MTVLDIDPPRPTLRLVSSTDTPAGATNGGSSGRDHRYRNNAPLHGDFRRLHRQVLRASLNRGERINPDALRVVLAAKAALQTRPARHFTASGIWQLMFVDVVGWCRNRQLTVPAGCAAALTLALYCLDADDSFADGSDPFDDLLDAVDECTGGWTEPSSAVPLRRGPKHR